MATAKLTIEQRMELADKGPRKGFRGNSDEAPAKAVESNEGGDEAGEGQPAADSGADSEPAGKEGSDGQEDSSSEATRGERSDAGGEKDGDEPESASDAKVEVASVRELLESGDLRKLAELTGASVKKVDTSNAKFKILNRRNKKLEQDIAKLKQDAMFVQQEKGRLAQQKKELGDPDSARKAFEAKEYHKVGRYLEQHLGYSFTTIAQRMARHNAGLSKEKLAELEEREEFEKQKRDFEAKRKAEQESAKKSTDRAANLEAVRKKIAGHPASKLEGGDAAVLAILEQHWDEDAKGLRGGMNLQKAADMVKANVDKYVRNAAAVLGLELVEKGSAGKARQAPPTEKKPAPPEPAKKPGKLSREERMALADKRVQRRRAAS